MPDLARLAAGGRKQQDAPRAHFTSDLTSQNGWI